VHPLDAAPPSQAGRQSGALGLSRTPSRCWPCPSGGRGAAPCRPAERASPRRHVCSAGLDL